MRVLVLSDTHVPGRARSLPPQVHEALERADAILHAGDFTDEGCLIELELFAPVRAVYGNNDGPPLTTRLPARRVVLLNGYRIGLVHGDQGEGETTPERAWNAFFGRAGARGPAAGAADGGDGGEGEGGPVDAVVFGHSHVPWLEWREGRLLLNPGSPTDRRREPAFSYAWLHLGERLEAEIVRFGP